jgi:uncharacterized phage protein (TIGR01671 family)
MAGLLREADHGSHNRRSTDVVAKDEQAGATATGRRDAMSASGYRIWITKARQMCPVTAIRWDHEGKLPFLSAAFLFRRANGPATHAACSSRDGVLMAATGIQDRYGAEIFEGDILNVRGRGEWGEPAVVMREARRGSGFVYAFPGSADERVALRAGDDIEIVGNIHEHPALLT